MLPSGGGGGGGVRLSGGPTLLEGDKSDVSSVISISDTLHVSDTEEEMERGSDRLVDKQKYRMPDIGKTRLNLRTKEPLGPPSPLTGNVRQQNAPPRNLSPETPRTFRTAEEAVYATPLTQAAPENVNDSEGPTITTLSRSNSIYTLGRAGLQDQLAQLTRMKLPDANSLAKRITDIPTAAEAAKALSDAAEQIRLWINKVSDVLNGLNAEDDVEWAAAGGREGIEDVDNSIRRFGGLVEVYLSSIDELQTRTDVSSLSAEQLTLCVRQMETILSSWNAVKKMLDGVKVQVELAMEWEELWNRDLGEVAQETEGLNRLVFEMEERRHQGAGCILTSKDSIDLGDLETIVEERPSKGAFGNTEQLGAGLTPPAALFDPTSQEHDKDDSSLLALFARMQPLRASLDFLPMKLSVFHNRADPVFPSACQDLDLRRTLLESQWQKLEADAEFLRRELGEDRWILVFRNAGRQALKMCESISRSYTKLKEGVDADEFLSAASSFARKVENYTAKRTHYGPAIGRVLAIIDRGVQDRLTVNGEILRLQSDMRERWTSLQASMEELDLTLEEIAVETRDDKQLRDSVSTVLSSERSVASSLVDTPNSSPASSVMGSSRRGSYQGSRTPTPLTNAKTRPVSYAKTKSDRLSLSSSIPRRIPLTHQASPVPTRSASPSPLAARSSRIPSSATTRPLRLEPPAPARPRWSRSTIVETKYFPPFSALEPSPYAKPPVEKRTNFLRSTRAISTPVTPSNLSHQSTNTRIPSTPASANPSLRLSHASSSQQSHPTTPSSSSAACSSNLNRKSLLPVPSSAPQLRPARTPIRQRSRPSLRTPSSSTTSTRRSSMAPLDGNEADSEGPASLGRRRSGRPKGFAISLREERPPWRP